MKIRYITREQYENLPRSHNKLQPILDAFIKSEAEVAEIDIAGHYKSQKTAVSSLHNAIRRSGYAIEVHSCKGKIYLVRKITEDGMK